MLATAENALEAPEHIWISNRSTTPLYEISRDFLANDKYNPLFETHNPAKPFVKSTMKPDSRNKTERWRSIEQFDSQ